MIVFPMYLHSKVSLSRIVVIRYDRMLSSACPVPLSKPYTTHRSPQCTKRLGIGSI